ncbi:VIT family-domain-containing protein [Lasiosphaeria miniovina]|uniref:VIT family-domain-containing protein n=1 Tax=Lasiosphaeria miniovina TaxID=1954250 RepID=A0AA40AB04_9PEZI|nr:VIT family-domain-containing protein [Lasiosphaeria miniovina]KAK0712541.1 VIT family-domain-containing protein [Lasiosphaeria miniovina]
MPAHAESSPLLGRPRTPPAEPGVERGQWVSSPRLRPAMINRVSSSTHLPAAAAHVERHSGGYDAVLRDVILGFSDGLTVPFALTAGLSSLGSTRIVIMGGLAELFSGMISMGLGAYLAGVSERQHWEAEHARECWEVDHVPDEERSEIYDILARYGVTRAAAEPMVSQLCADKTTWVNFMMDFELSLPEPDVSRAWVSAATMGLSYFVGGLIPMLPYFFMDQASQALLVSVAITVVILLLFGYAKNWLTIRTKKAGVWGALQTLVIGALAAGTSYAIVRLLDTN